MGRLDGIFLSFKPESVSMIINGGDGKTVDGINTIEIFGVQFPQYPGYTFTVSDTLEK
jgi:hypothetical protein